ncbi:hypothetical protein ABIC70_001022 [Methylobacterium sp. 1973]
MSLLKPRGVEWVFAILFGSAVALAILLGVAGQFPR